MASRNPAAPGSGFTRSKGGTMAAFEGKTRDGVATFRTLGGRRLDRRGFVGVGAGAAALGLGARAFAQDGGFTPTEPQETLEAGQVVQSVTREQYAEQFFAAYPMEEG